MGVTADVAAGLDDGSGGGAADGVRAEQAVSASAATATSAVLLTIRHAGSP